MGVINLPMVHLVIQRMLSDFGMILNDSTQIQQGIGSVGYQSGGDVIAQYVTGIFPSSRGIRSWLGILITLTDW